MNTKEGFLTRTSKSWVSDRVRGLFDDIGFDEVLAEGIELIKNRRVLDFTIQKGRFSARVFRETGAPKLVSVDLPVIEDESWDNIFERLASQSLFLASFLSGSLPPETLEAFRDAGADLFPESGKDFVLQTEGEEISSLQAEHAAVIYKFCEGLSEDAFNYVVFRGRGKEETIVEIRRKRLILNQREVSASGVHVQQVHGEQAGADGDLDLGRDFWLSSGNLDELTFEIKADELPAAILRHLEPLPLNGLEEEVEQLLNEAYDHITQRAQAYGLGM